MMSLPVLFKTCMAVTLVGGCIVAAFYLGYILVLLSVLVVVAGISSAIFNYKEKRDRFNFDDY